MSGAAQVIEHRERCELARLIRTGAGREEIRFAAMRVLIAHGNLLVEEASAAAELADSYAGRVEVLRALVRKTGQAGALGAYRLLDELRSAPCAVRVAPAEATAIAAQWRERLRELIADPWAGAREADDEMQEVA